MKKSGATVTRRTAIQGLYAITPETGDKWDAATLQAAVAAALRGGAAVIQYRNKHSSAALKRKQAAALAALCRRHGVPLIVNDDPVLAQDCGADGVHLGRDDPDIAAARRCLGPGALIGVSCYDDLERARRAEAAGADYVAFGRFFPSRSKPGASPAPPEILQQARNTLKIPIVAIGGITPENGADLLARGAAALAVIGGLFHADDIETAARRYAALFHRPDPECGPECGPECDLTHDLAGTAGGR